MAEVEAVPIIEATNNSSSTSPKEQEMGQNNEKMVEQSQELQQNSIESDIKENSEIKDVLQLNNNEGITENNLVPPSEEKLPTEVDKIDEEISKMEKVELPSVEDELMELFKEVADSNGIEEVKKVTEEASNLDENNKQQDEEAGLLDECESPKQVQHEEENSNGVDDDDEESNQNAGGETSEPDNEELNQNGDGGIVSEHENEESNQNGSGETSEHENEESTQNGSGETSEHENNENAKESINNEENLDPQSDSKVESIIEPIVGEGQLLPPNSINNDENLEKPHVDEAAAKEKEELPSIDPIPVEVKKVDDDIEMQDIKQEIELDINDENDDKDTSKLENNEAKVDNVDALTVKSENEIEVRKEADELKSVENDVVLKVKDEEMEVEKVDEPSELKIVEEIVEQKIEEVKEEPKVEKPVSSEPVRFSFMKKFATSCGKLPRPDLEELLLEKITESLVYRSHCADLRIMYEKQEEQIERLQARLAIVTKQYNDLEMIHKRVEKDLKERHDGSVQPVRITRAVGLQVFLEQRNVSTQNLNTIQSNTLNSNKQKSAAASTPSNMQSKTIPFKRSVDAVTKTNTEPDAKRKKCAKIITPLRPMLSEKEESSLKLQEASIEQSLRAKITKTPQTVHSNLKAQLNTSSPAIQNGNKSLIKPQNSASIDLTDDLDESPSEKVTPNPPALVAIQRSQMAQMTQSSPVRPLILKSNPVISRSPNMPFRSEGLRSSLASIYKHPAPLPPNPPQVVLPQSKRVPPRPNIKINNVQNGIIVSWTVEGLNTEHAEILCYQIYAYEETNSPPSTENWKHVGDVKALLLPMAVTLTQFQEGQKYFFAVRAVDVLKRLGQFSLPKTWN